MAGTEAFEKAIRAVLKKVEDNTKGIGKFMDSRHEFTAVVSEFLGLYLEPSMERSHQEACVRLGNLAGEIMFQVGRMYGKAKHQLDSADYYAKHKLPLPDVEPGKDDPTVITISPLIRARQYFAWVEKDAISAAKNCFNAFRLYCALGGDGSQLSRKRHAHSSADRWLGKGSLDGLRGTTPRDLFYAGVRKGIGECRSLSGCRGGRR